MDSKSLLLLSRTALFLFLCGIMISSCRQADSDSKTDKLVRIQGPAMGTTYKIAYRDSLDRDIQGEIEKLLEEINASLSTYVPSSVISKFNKNDSLVSSDLLLKYMTEMSLQIAEQTEGAFDPTIFPLSKFWGFDGKHHESIDTLVLDSIRALVGYDKIILKDYAEGGYLLGKKSKNLQMNFNAIAKGYGVDLLAIKLHNLGIKHFLVDIGGEMVAKGQKSGGLPWRIAINYPEVDRPGGTKAAGFLNLKEQAIATSGNYRNFYEVDGRKLVHTIDPETGYARENDLLSASIIITDTANDFGSSLKAKMSIHPCAVADAYATSCMVMGFEKAKVFVESIDGIEAILIYVDDNNESKTYATKGLGLELLD